MWTRHDRKTLLETLPFNSVMMIGNFWILDRNNLNSGKLVCVNYF